MTSRPPAPAVGSRCTTSHRHLSFAYPLAGYVQPRRGAARWARTMGLQPSSTWASHPSDYWRARRGGDDARGAGPRVSTDDPARDLAPFFERVDYPYYVLTVRAPDEEMSGCLAGFVTQCSIDPPNFIACISRLNHTLGVAVRSSAMGLHLLGEDQLDMARLFGEETGDAVDKFADVDWRIGTTGAPLLADVVVGARGSDPRPLLGRGP